MRRSLFGASPSNRSVDQQRERNKRRSFAFMKYSPKTESNTSMRRTREHARQIALQLAEDAAADRAYSPPPSFEEHSSSSSFDLNPITGEDTTATKAAITTPQQPKNRLDKFVEREQARSNFPKPSEASSVISLDTSVSSKSRTVKSMPTFPSNSSMQARNVEKRQQRTIDAFMASTPPSPYDLTKSKGSSGSARSFGSGGSGNQKSNRLVNYAQTPRAPVAPGFHGASTPGSTSTTASATSSPNFFSDEFGGNGFTFDAFGLDEHEVDQEVSAAMKELAGEWGEEFPEQSFDSPNGSRASTPGLDRDGFENGFRLTGISGLPLQVRQSPAGSDRSSLTSSTDKAGEGHRNYFKEQAGFTAAAPGFKNKGTPPRHPQSDGWAEFGTSAFGDAFSPSYARSEPGFGSKKTVGWLPNIPRLDKDEDDFFDASNTSFERSTQAFPGTPSKGPKWSSTTSDIVLSDAGISSDMGVNSEVGDASGFEINGVANRKAKPKALALEEKKEEGDESFAEWSSRSPVKGDASWGEDMTPDNPLDLQVSSPKNWSSTEKPALPPPASISRTTPTSTNPSLWEQKRRQQSKQETPVTSFAGLKNVAPKEPTVQEHRATECIEQRSSFDSLKSRLHAPKITSSQSDIVDSRSKGNAEFSAVFDRVRRGGPAARKYEDSTPIRPVSDLASKFEKKSTMNIPRTSNPSYDDEQYNVDSYNEEDYPDGDYGEDYPEENYAEGVYAEEDYAEEDYAEEEAPEYVEEYYDDTYDEEEFYEDEEPPSLSRPMTYKEKREMELREQKQQESKRVTAEDKATKKMTYREKRELELRKEKEEKERKEAEERAKKSPEIDVAESIRRRIAENKRRVMEGQSASGADVISNGRNLLKKVSMGSKITQFKARPESQPEFMVKDLKKVASHDPDDPISPTPSQSTTVTESRSAASGGTDTTDPVSEIVKRDAPSPMAALHEAIANRAAASAAPVNPMAAVHAAIANKANLAKVEALTPEPADEGSISVSADDTKNKLNAFLAHRLADGPSLSASFDDHEKPVVKTSQQPVASARMIDLDPQGEAPKVAPVQATLDPSDGRPSLKDDPKYDRYFRMLKVGMPMDVVKHAMTRDGIDASIMDGDHSKPAGFGSGGVPLKDDPKFTKYFKMMKIGLPMGAVKNAMERDGLDPSVMDRDHNLPANSSSSDAGGGVGAQGSKVKDTHRRTRLHWETLRKVRADSLWAKINEDEELEEIEIDEDEFQELFQAELTPAETNKSRNSTMVKRGAAVRVIDSKRANNGGIILARLKLTHDEMADAVDRIDHRVLNAEQMQNIIEYLPTNDERKALENYMLSGGVDAAEKFDGLCECEKFMVAMMTVKHAKRKVRALLFKMQFKNCMELLIADASIVETACDELSNSVRLRKLLGIVLNVGNRLNTAGVAGKKSKAGAFSLESLLKLGQAKAFDKKTTFLHYIVLVVQRNNELLLRFKDDIPTVLKADRVYWDQVEQDLEEVENQLENVRRISLHQAQLMTAYKLRKKQHQRPQQDNDDNSLSDTSMTLEEEVESLRATEIGVFTLGSIKKVSALREKVETTKRKFAKLREYFGEEEKQDMQPHELFNIIVTFARDFEKAKEQVMENQKKKLREERKLKRANSENGGKNARPQPGRTSSAPMLRASNLQPNLQKVVKDMSRRPPRDSQQDKRAPGPHVLPVGVHPGRNSIARHGQDGQMQHTPSNGVSKNSNGHIHRPVPNGRPRPRPQSDHTDDASTVSSSSRPTTSSMRQKAMIRRRRAHAQNTTSVVSTPPRSSSTTASMTTMSSAHRIDKTADMRKYAALGRRVANNTTDMSPRSTIRQRRREEQRRARPGPTEEVQWPEEADENMDDLDFVLD